MHSFGDSLSFLCDTLVPSAGQLSVQRAMLMVKELKSKYKDSVDGYIEEGVVRRELADNFCFYNDKYDSVEGKHHDGALRCFKEETLIIDSSSYLWPLSDQRFTECCTICSLD